MEDMEKAISSLTDIENILIARQDICPREELQYWIELQEGVADALALLKEQKEEHKRLLSWLSKFCRHIDNGDKWLTDEENLAFFKGKMKQQFGWDTD